MHAAERRAMDDKKRRARKGDKRAGVRARTSSLSMRGRAAGIIHDRAFQDFFFVAYKDLRLPQKGLAALGHIERMHGLEVFGAIYPDSEIYLVVREPASREVVGYLEASRLKKIGLAYLRKGPCGARWRALGEPEVWTVSQADIDPRWQRKGVATLAYAAVAHHVLSRGAIMVPHSCAGGSTSGKASMVWRALCRSFSCLRGEPPMIAWA